MWKRGDLEHHDDDEVRYVPRPTGASVGDPAALAVGALVIGTLSLGGLGLLNDANNIYPMASARLRGRFSRVSWARRSPWLLWTHPGDPAWVPRVAQAGVLIGGIAFVLRLISTAIAAVEVTNSGYAPPLKQE